MKIVNLRRWAMAAGVLCAMAGTVPALAQASVQTVQFTQRDKGELKIGDAPPKIEVEKWIKGKAVNSFEADKVYVVEFWATWCPPCRKSIPHLTEMAKEYKDKVTFIGVSIWEESHPIESRKYLERVETFVKDMGDKMDYTVAFGGEGAAMATTWMEAANQNGIPAAFIVQNKKVVWIGNPLMGLDKALEQVVAGKYDMKDAVEKAAKGKAKEKRMRDLQKAYTDAMESGDDAAALKALNQVAEVDTAMDKSTSMERLKLMFATKDADGAYRFAKEKTEGVFKDDAMMLNAFAWNLLDSDWVTKHDYDFTLKVAKRADEVSNHKDAAIIDTLARAYYEKKDYAKAVELEQKALDTASDEQEDMKDEMRAALKKYKQAAGK